MNQPEHRTEKQHIVVIYPAMDKEEADRLLDTLDEEATPFAITPGTIRLVGRILDGIEGEENQDRRARLSETGAAENLGAAHNGEKSLQPGRP